MYLIVFYFELHNLLHGYYIEDLMFQDLHIFSSSMFPGFYLAFMLTLPLLLFAQRIYSGEMFQLKKPIILEGVWMHHAHVNNWELIDYRNYKHFPIFALVNLIFMTFEYQSLLKIFSNLSKYQYRFNESD
jgi:hypothetical protein